MKVIVPDMAHDTIDSLFEYLAIYSYRNATQIIDKIYDLIYDLGDMPYLGKPSTELPDKHFRELLYRKNRNAYRILYLISEETDRIYILHVSNCKQEFKNILKLHNYFNNYFNL